MKKLIALLMVCGFAFAFVACGGQKTDEAAETTEEAVDDAVDAAEESTEDAMDAVEDTADSVSSEVEEAVGE